MRFPAIVNFFRRNHFFNFTILMIKKLTALTLATLFAASAQAAVVEFNATKTMTTTNWNDNLSIGLFDSKLGTLNSITFVLNGSVSGNGRAESLDASASNVTLSLASTLTLHRPDGSNLVVSNPVFSNGYNLSAFDGNIDFSGTSGATTGPVSANASNSFVSSNANDFALFSANGGGNVLLNLSAVGNSTGTGAGNLITQFSTAAAGDVKVVYDYTAVTAVPEPETYGMMLLGLGMVGAVARRRAAKNKAA